MILRHVFLLLAAVSLTGCQEYKPQPLDLQQHRVLWEQRAPDAPEVAAFAKQFAESGRPMVLFDIDDGVTIAEAEVIALVFNPKLREARAIANVAVASAQFAGLWEDPILDVNVLRILESVPAPWIAGAGVSFTIPLSGRLGAEKGRARAEEFAALARASQHEWEVVNELRFTWLEWSAIQYQAEVAKELVMQLESVVEVTDRLEVSGELPRLETRLFRIEAATRNAAVQQLELQALDLELRLKGLMGLRPESPVLMTPELCLPGLPPSEDQELILLNANPALAVVKADYQVAEHTLNREIRKQYPDLVIGPAYENEDDQSRVGLTGSVLLPILNRNRQGIAEAQATREASQAAVEGTYETLVHELFRAQQTLERQTRLREHFESNLIPLVDDQVRDARRMRELGELNTLVQLESIARQAETKIEFIGTRQAEAMAALRVQSLLGPQTVESMIDKGEGR